MAHVTKKRRGGGKKKTLFSTTVVSYSLTDELPPDVQKIEAEAFSRSLQRLTLKNKLKEIEERAVAVLGQHDLPTTWPEMAGCVGNYDLPLFASYAADILFCVRQVRDFVHQGKAEHAAYEALRLGDLVASHDAELNVAGRESTRTKKSRESRSEKKLMRQQRMLEIAHDRGWTSGHELSKTELQGVYTLLRERYPEYRDRPTDQVLSKDALEVGFRQ